MCELLAIYPCSFFSSGEVGWRLVFLLFTSLLSLVFVFFFFLFGLCIREKFLMCVVSLVLECTLSSSIW